MEFQPIHVFVSSCMRTEELMHLRCRIKEAIDGTKLFVAYLFEENGASSLPAEIDYRLGVHEAQVCVFVIESEFQVPWGVQKEMDEANALGKRCFYYFYRHNADDEIDLQKQLRGAECPHTYEVESLDELPARIAADLTNEMVRVYRQIGVGFSYQNLLNPSVDIPNDPTWDEAIAGKAPVANYPATKAFFAKFAFGIDSPTPSVHAIAAELSGKPGEIVSANGLDECCALFMEVALGNRTVKDFNAAILYEEIEAHLPERYAAVSKKRWQAIQRFYQGDTQDAFEYMKSALELAEGNAVAEWVVDDILIDLRNLDAELRGIVANIDEYQERLTGKDKPLVYPIADRLNSEMYATLIDESYKRGLRSAGTVVMFEDVTRFVDALSGLAMVSLLYGSYTYIRLIPQKLRRIAYVVNLQYKSRDLERLLLKLALVDGDTKNARALMNKYSDLLCGLSATEAEASFRFVLSCAVGKGRDDAVFEAFSVFGSYMDDGAFEAAFQVIRDMVDARVRDAPRPGNALSALVNNAPRIADKEWLFSVCRAAIEYGPNTFWREAGAKMLAAGAVEVGDLGRILVEGFLDLVGSCIGRDQSVDNSIALFLVNLRNDSRFIQRVDVIAQELSGEARANYEINCPDCGFADIEAMAEGSINLILKGNETQGQGGAYSYGRDEYLCLEYACEAEGSLADEILLRAAKACLETLRAPGQILKSKCDALRLLAYLYGESNAVRDLLFEQLEAINLDDSDLNRGALLGGPYEPRLARACLAVLKGAVLGEDCEALRMGISSMHHANEFSQMRFAEFLFRVVKSGGFTRIPNASASRVVSFLQNMAESTSREVCVSAINALGSLACDGRFGSEVVVLLHTSFTTAAPRVKHAILNAVEANPSSFGEYGAYIVSQASRDANYYIRMRGKGFLPDADSQVE